MTIADALAKINEINVEHGPKMFPRMPPHRYWTLKIGKGKATYAVG